MKPDLQSLEITKRDLTKLYIIEPNQAFEVSIWGILWRTFFLWIFIITIANTFADSELVSNFFGLFMFIAPFAAIIPAWNNHIKFKKLSTEASTKLIEEVQKINSIVRAIDVNDQLVEAGNKGMITAEREKVIEALKLAREDLVRALKTEKILRENKDIIDNDSEFLINNLSNLRALQVSEQATDFGNILSKTLQIAVEVQAEMNQLVAESGVKST